jgi:hypothetical protein
VVTNSILCTVTSPLKRDLFCLHQIPSSSKRRRKEKIPSKVTSQICKDYHARQTYEKMRHRKLNITSETQQLGKLKKQPESDSQDSREPELHE